MRKTYVLDSSVLLHASYALTSFEDNHIILPLAVLEDLDAHQLDEGEQGDNARQAIRFLDSLRTQGELADGVKLPNGGSLQLEIFADGFDNYTIDLPDWLDPTTKTGRVLKTCKGLRKFETPAILVSKDIVTRIKAQIMGIPAEDFTTDQISSDTNYTGRGDFYVADSQLNDFGTEGKPLAIHDLYMVDKDGTKVPVNLTENQFLVLHSDMSNKKTLLGRYHSGKITKLQYTNAFPFNVKTKNVGQQFLQEALMLPADEIPLVIVKGPAGTAKTFFSIAVGLEEVVELRQYRKVLVCRSNAQFDSNIGYLPGSEQEKILPLLRPVMDNLENLIDLDHSKKDGKTVDQQGKINYFLDSGMITAEAMNFMRGRSITDTWMIIDEAQNLTPRQVKGVVTRVGKGTKVILLGDPEQIDHPLLNEQNNGLSYAADRMKGSPLCAQLTMLSTECERSDLASDAATRM